MKEMELGQVGEIELEMSDSRWCGGGTVHRRSEAARKIWVVVKKEGARGLKTAAKQVGRRRA